MRFTSSVLAAATTLSTVQAQNGYKGFNYGSTFGNNAPKLNADFAYEFNAAKNLPNTNGGYTSARLYTMIQANTTNTPIEAIQAAIDTKTKLLLGLWASAGSAQFANEIAALKAAISQYGSAFTDLVVGISVGSEDLYRITPTGIANNAGVGAQPNDLVSYIQQTRSTISGTGLSGKPVGHVDTWTAYVNASNNAVISNLDFLGVDAYPYFQTTMANSIGNANQTFYDAYHQTVAAAQGKPVWVTETGWPITGATQNQAVASADNARVYWEDVACSLTAANINFFYYDLQEAQYSSPSPDFGIYGAGDLGQLQPRFDLSCGSSAKPLPTATSSGLGLPTSTGTPRTTLPINGIPTTSSPIAAPTGLPPPLPTDLTGPFQYPHLIIPVDKTNPSAPLGSQFLAQISATRSTIFNFDVPSDYTGKTCNLVFHLPPDTRDWSTPYQLRAPGGIIVSELGHFATVKTSAANVGVSQPVGSINQLIPGKGHLISSGPCEAGLTVAYQIDALSGLDLQFFQMVTPPLGLFMTVS